MITKLLVMTLLGMTAFAQSNDLFVMIGSDFVRPSLAPRANYNIGIGHTFKCLDKNPIGNEVTFAYTYENAGTHGFFRTDYGSHTEAIGIMRNFTINKKYAWYTWPSIGITTMTGDKTMNRLYGGFAVGAIIRFSKHHSIWIQETYNKVTTIPWYTTTSIGYAASF